MDLSTLDCLLPVLNRQATVNGSICILVALIFLGVVFLGAYILKEFFKSANKIEDRWFAFIGTAIILIGTIGFLIFLWQGLPRVLNPTFYALDYYIEVLKITKGFLKP